MPLSKQRRCSKKRKLKLVSRVGQLSEANEPAICQKSDAHFSRAQCLQEGAAAAATPSLFRGVRTRSQRASTKALFAQEARAAQKRTSSRAKDSPDAEIVRRIKSDECI